MSKYEKLRKIAVIPTYYDTGNILKVLNKFTINLVDEVCLIIDCATDKEVLKLQKAINPRIPIHIITNIKRNGIGFALKQGINYALKNNFDIIVVMAGNNKDDPSEIPRLLFPITTSNVDYVQGSRFLPGGKRVKNPFLRGLFSKFFPFLWTFLTKTRCTDVTNGFRAYKSQILANPKINIWQDWLDEYQLEYYIHYKVLTLGYKIQEVPVSKIYTHSHKGGYSKILPLRDWWTIVGPLISLKLGLKE
jgi:dolichol-phosphate mannosyltransferase